MDATHLNRRQLIVALLTAATCGIGVYLLHEPFHDLLHAAAGMSGRIADTAGTVLVVLLSFLINNLVSMAIFKDVTLGMRAVQDELGQKLSGNEAGRG